MPAMSLESDLRDIIIHEFENFGIECNAKDMNVGDLAACYCEMLKRHIAPYPRTVYFSNEIRISLDRLAQETDPTQQKSAWEAWNTTFLLYRLLSKGEDVTRFLSKHIKDSPRKQGISDKLLWDYGMHHFHLCRDMDPKTPAFVRGSDYLLFAVIRSDYIYFVDIRRHQDPE